LLHSAWLNVTQGAPSLPSTSQLKSTPLTLTFTLRLLIRTDIVMLGLDPGISRRRHKIAGLSPAMTRKGAS
jgi:hypothetical protein